MTLITFLLDLVPSKEETLIKVPVKCSGIVSSGLLKNYHFFMIFLLIQVCSDAVEIILYQI